MRVPGNEEVQWSGALRGAMRSGASDTSGGGEACRGDGVLILGFADNALGASLHVFGFGFSVCARQ
jgi:hypothetical protein